MEDKSKKKKIKDSFFIMSLKGIKFTKKGERILFEKSVLKKSGNRINCRHDSLNRSGKFKLVIYKRVPFVNQRVPIVD